jgi:hypothetical protein
MKGALVRKKWLRDGVKKRTSSNKNQYVKIILNAIANVEELLYNSLAKYDKK